MVVVAVRAVRGFNSFGLSIDDCSRSPLSQGQVLFEGVCSYAADGLDPEHFLSICPSEHKLLNTEIVSRADYH